MYVIIYVRIKALEPDSDESSSACIATGLYAFREGWLLTAM